MSDDVTPFVQDEDEYWRAARGFVRVMIADLNDSLKECGLSGPKRRLACENAAFAICNTIDQCWIRSDGVTSYPALAFSRTFLNVDTPIERLFPIQLPHRSVELHAMVCDEIVWFFDERKEKLPTNSVGAIGDEVPDERPVRAEATEPIRQPCNLCKGSGACFCIRKGLGTASGCPRCAGDGKCRHCQGTGVWQT